MQKSEKSGQELIPKERRAFHVKLKNEATLQRLELPLHRRLSGDRFPCDIITKALKMLFMAFHLGPQHKMNSAIQKPITCCCCCYPDPSEGCGMVVDHRAQKHGNSSVIGPKIVERPREPKSTRRKESVAGQCRMR